ncbi:MAG: TolB family protein, partial [Planctomycetota bacterium]
MSPAPRRRVLAGRALRTLVGPAGLLALLPLLPATAGEGLRIAFVEAPAGATESAGRDLGGTILAGRYPRGARLVIADLDDIGATRRSVSEGFTSAADPAFSLDGKGLLFAGCRAPGEPLQIWELGADFTRAVPLARCDADCVRPVPLPGGRIVFASLLAGEREEEGDRLSFSLFQWGRHLETPERLTFNPSSDFDPALLPDGRIAYSSWQHVGSHRPPRGTVALMLVNSDGTGVFPFTGNHRGPWLKRAAAPIGGGRTALIRADRFTGLGAGELVATSLDDPFAPYEILMPA